jgi:tRNA-dihydrouridine synthase
MVPRVTCQSNNPADNPGKNATEPSPAIAPGAEDIEPRREAERLVEQWGPSGLPPALADHVPGFDAPFFQAGLAGYSDAAMRIIARRHGCPLCVTEALLDRTILAGGRGFAKADLGELHDNVPGGDEDHPLVGQLMGSDPAEMASAALKMVEQRARSDRAYRELALETAAPSGAAVGETRLDARLNGGLSGEPIAPRLLSEHTFQAIDVNLACPVKKIRSKARGGHWLAEPDGAIAIIEAVRDSVPSDIPVTVKIRRSYDDTEEMADNFDRIVSAAFDIGALWITVHGRTVQQKYVGPSRWDLLRDIARRHQNIERDRYIFGSGDVWRAAEIYRMLAYTGVTAASVARGAIGNPWIFRQARNLLEGSEPHAPTITEQRRVLEDHFALAMSVNGAHKSAEAFTGRTMRKFGIRFAAHHPAGEDVRRRFITVRSLAEWRAVLDEHYIGDPAEQPAQT